MHNPGCPGRGRWRFCPRCGAELPDPRVRASAPCVSCGGPQFAGRADTSCAICRLRRALERADRMPEWELRQLRHQAALLAQRIAEGCAVVRRTYKAPPGSRSPDPGLARSRAKKREA
jgi:hypothetical protein